MSIFERIKDFWKENEIKILLIGTVIFIFILFVLNYKNKGSWSDNYFYDNQAETTGKQKTKKKVSFQDKEFVKEEERTPKESKLEIATRASLERIFNKPFAKDRPDFLKNPVTKNFNLELDCFNKELRLGVEVNGIQHYKYVPYFHKNFEAFRNQQYRDELKRRMCRDEGIILIEVPYTVKIPDLDNFLINELRKNGYKI